MRKWTRFLVIGSVVSAAGASGADPIWNYTFDADRLPDTNGSIKNSGGVPYSAFLKTTSGSGTFTSESISNNIYSGSTIDSNNAAWYHRTSLPDELANLNSDTGYTLEARIKIDNIDEDITNAGISAFSIQLDEARGGVDRFWEFGMAKDSGQYKAYLKGYNLNIAATANIDNTGFHIYRVTVLGTTATLYLDGNPTPVGSITDLRTDITSDELRFGDFTGVGDSAFQIDYLSVFDGGAVAPDSGSSTWNKPGSGDWNDAINWLGGVPNAVDAVANFTGAISSAQTVFTNTNVTVGTIKLDNANKYVIGGAGTLTLQTSSGSALINVVQGSHKINLPLNVNSDTNAAVADGATLAISDPVMLAGGTTLTKSGGGTLLFQSTINAPSAATIKINGGVANFDAANNDPDITINVDPATVNLGATQTLGSMVLSLGGNTLRVGRDSSGANVPAKLNVSTLHVTGGGAVNTLEQSLAGNEVRIANTLQIDAGSKLKKQGAGVLVTGAVSIASTGELDLTTGKMVVDYSGASPIAGIRQDLQAGRITTSSASNGTTLGYAEANKIYPSGGSFGGVTVDADMVLVKYTLAGDTNFDEKVNTLDFNNLAGGFGTGSIWTAGDFNYNGVVDSTDFTLLVSNYGKTLPPAASLGSVVPEPASFALIALAPLALRRRKH